VHLWARRRPLRRAVRKASTTTRWCGLDLAQSTSADTELPCRTTSRGTAWTNAIQSHSNWR
jgi:hypothetical protein